MQTKLCAAMKKKEKTIIKHDRTDNLPDVRECPWNKIISNSLNRPVTTSLYSILLSYLSTWLVGLLLASIAILFSVKGYRVLTHYPWNVEFSCMRLTDFHLTHVFNTQIKTTNRYHRSCYLTYSRNNVCLVFMFVFKSIIIIVYMPLVLDEAANLQD